MPTKNLGLVLFALAGLAPGCAASPGATEPATRDAPILVQSSPASGQDLAKAPDVLTLRFSRPARLLEVTVSGSDGSLMPMMVTSAGATETYSVPLPTLQPGRYEIAWRAEVGGRDHEGVIAFTIGSPRSQ